MTAKRPTDQMTFKKLRSARAFAHFDARMKFQYAEALDFSATPRLRNFQVGPRFGLYVDTYRHEEHQSSTDMLGSGTSSTQRELARFEGGMFFSLIQALDFAY